MAVRVELYPFKLHVPVYHLHHLLRISVVASLFHVFILFDIYINQAFIKIIQNKDLSSKVLKSVIKVNAKHHFQQVIKLKKLKCHFKFIQYKQMTMENAVSYLRSVREHASSLPGYFGLDNFSSFILKAQNRYC